MVRWEESGRREERVRLFGLGKVLNGRFAANFSEFFSCCVEMSRSSKNLRSAAVSEAVIARQTSHLLIESYRCRYRHVAGELHMN